ncbi:MAG: hypothetical protein KAX18_02150 [Candidatus Lokiarchaeota archaeon]|nr:hypothetical protein [Candidatus Lokiarchaeota archaeon]
MTSIRHTQRKEKRYIREYPVDIKTQSTYLVVSFFMYWKFTMKWIVQKYLTGNIEKYSGIPFITVLFIQCLNSYEKPFLK